MKDHGQQARASENFAGPVDFETPRPDLPVHFLNFQKPWLWPWSFINPGGHESLMYAAETENISNLIHSVSLAVLCRGLSCF